MTFVLQHSFSIRLQSDGTISELQGNEKIIESQNCLTWKGPLMASQSSYEQGRLQLHQVAQSPIQPDLECLQGWGIHHQSGFLLSTLTMGTGNSTEEIKLSLKIMVLLCFLTVFFLKSCFFYGNKYIKNGSDFPSVTVVIITCAYFTLFFSLC